MKRGLAFISVLMFVFCSGCGDSHESLAKQAASTMKEMVSILDGVKDEASAIAAKPKLKSLMERLNDINARQSKLPAPTEAEIKSMESGYGKDMEEVQQKFTNHMLRISLDPKLRSALDDVAQGMKKP